MKPYGLLFIAMIMCVHAAIGQDDKKVLSNTHLFAAPKDSASRDSLLKTRPAALARKDSGRKKHDPRIATKRSLILPGWGQAYNKEYWKIPIVYGILAIPTTLFFYNNSYYNKTKFAYEARYKAQQGDSSDLPKIDPEIANISISGLQNYRNAFRRDRDYAVLWFLAAWALQVADATVFAHLKEFDVSNDLTMQVNPSFNPYTRTPALSLTLNLKNASQRKIVAR
ncbi:DUF5683 domain-containing protein [Sediminibacterium soli]|uniref:DUF5683 domain-containing protein n=1 Tax=Sediminibacterium soli TaxID=2698829 RepID=UPI00137A321F|nr:DUF5683 domain-containing protein [Sediminibacterium soli]NCI46998.1 hypothetical protein [Sediminibacterium soli]